MLLLVRHGETEWNLLKRLQGQQDIPLSEAGIQQARQLGAYFARQSMVFEHVYTSDLLRAYQTAQWITEKMDIRRIIVEPALRERNYGELEGKYLSDVVEIMPDYYMNFGAVMRFGIESLEDMQRRMVAALTAIARQSDDSPTLVVSHGGAINAFLHFITNGEKGTGRGRLANTSITQLQWTGRTFHIHKYDETPHLSVQGGLHSID